MCMGYVHSSSGIESQGHGVRVSKDGNAVGLTSILAVIIGGHRNIYVLGNWLVTSE